MQMKTIRKSCVGLIEDHTACRKAQFTKPKGSRDDGKVLRRVMSEKRAQRHGRNENAMRGQMERKNGTRLNHKARCVLPAIETEARKRQGEGNNERGVKCESWRQQHGRMRARRVQTGWEKGTGLFLHHTSSRRVNLSRPEGNRS